MDILGFVPLLAWALIILALDTWDEHLRAVDGRGKNTDSATAMIWFFGCLFWFFIGIVLLLINNLNP